LSVKGGLCSRGGGRISRRWGKERYNRMKRIKVYYNEDSIMKPTKNSFEKAGWMERDEVNIIEG
jgi:hypothetical protein